MSGDHDKLTEAIAAQFGLPAHLLGGGGSSYTSFRIAADAIAGQQKWLQAELSRIMAESIQRMEQKQMEREWINSADSQAMLRWANGYVNDQSDYTRNVKISDRKLRLLAAAIYHADGKRSGIAKDMEDLVDNPALPVPEGILYWHAADRHAEFAIEGANVPPATQANLLREIIGNPFQPVTLCGVTEGISRTEPVPDCRACQDLLTPTVRSLAQAAYEERLESGQLNSDRLAILADALEEAGCTEPTILGHLRSPGPHVRGCWALDLVLGRE